MKNTDLHTHTYYSDGQISPKELVKLAKKRGIKNLALTDHNSIKGVREALSEGKKQGIRIIPALEIRVDKGEVLGYFIDYKNKKLIRVIKQIGKRVQDNMKDWCNKLNRAGYNITFSEIWKKFPKARGNINEFYPIYLLHLNGYGKTLEIARKLRKNKKFIKGRIKEITVVQGIKLIKKVGGVPILAHPWIEDEVLKEKNLKKYIKAGLKGIEINNGDRAPFKKKGIEKKIRRLAKRYKLIITSGSDYHGLGLVKQMPGNHELGRNNCDDSIIEILERAR